MKKYGDVLIERTRNIHEHYYSIRSYSRKRTATCTRFPYFNPTRMPRDFERDVVVEALFDTMVRGLGGLHGMCNGMHVRNRSGTRKYLLEQGYFHIRYSRSSVNISNEMHLENVCVNAVSFPPHSVLPPSTMHSCFREVVPEVDYLKRQTGVH